MTDHQPRDDGQRSSLRVDQEARRGAVIVRVSGDVDLMTAPVLAEHLRRAERGLDAGLLVLDMREVEFLASPGLAELLEHARLCADLGGRMVVVADQRAVLRTMEITGLTQIIAVAGSVDDAMSIEAGA